ncbi:MAG: outer membrane lipoprotein-sorting protein [Saprospiraceae bacterium]|nr:outer membrane lipoprotein-sorting protein [Saprospiraceae bacterium]
MRRFLSILIGIVSGCWVFAQTPETAFAIIKKADERARGKTSMAEMTITTVRPKWTREMDVKVWTKGNDLALILVRAPAKDKGTTFLKRKKEVWNWVPSLERTIKLPPSMMSQSWMGTDFTNDDLVKESSMVEDYTQTLLGSDVQSGLPCHKLELVPKPDAAVVWGKVLVWIDKKDYMEMRVEFYDEDGYLSQTMVGSEQKLLGGKLLPSRMEMTPADKPDQHTVITYQSLVFDKPIDDAFFTTENMTQVGN